MPEIVDAATAKIYFNAMKSGIKLNFTEEPPKQAVKEFAVTADAEGKADLSTATEVKNESASQGA